jgi:16S rRNA (uracil1498-N3)-methyltransferase
MARRRFFVDAVRKGEAALEGEAAEHLRRVLRAEPGEQYEISDNQSVYLAEIEGFRKGAVLFRVLERLDCESPPLRLTLLVSLIKFDRFEWIVEKATELGVEAIVPVMAGRSERGLDKAAARRVERWRRIALESSQQARRVRLPEICDCLSFREALMTQAGGRWMLDESREAPGILSALPLREARSSSDTVCLLVGPEGGWIEEERLEAAASGWARLSLGAQILRAETAAIAGIAVLAAAWAHQE